MDEILSAILAPLAEFLLEILCQLILELFAAFLVRAFDKAFGVFPSPSPILTGTAYLVFGLVAGGTSLLIFPHPLVHPSRIHGISLIVSPVVTGLIMSQIGNVLLRRGKHPVRIESFTYGFAFALGMATVRLVFTR